MRTLGQDIGATVLNQDIYEISATMKHRLGTRCVRGDKVYKYAKASTLLTTTHLLAHSAYHQHIMYAAIQAAVAAGNSRIAVTVAATDGAANNGAFAVGDLAEGTIAIFDADTAEWLNFTVRDNTVRAAGTGTLYIDLEGELPIALTTSDHVEVMCTPYIVNTTNTQDAYCFMGLPMRLATVAEPYFWLQTAGPCFIDPQADVGINAASQPNVQVVVRHDGSVDICTYDEAGVRHAQMVGHVMTFGTFGTMGQGAPFINLQISY
jgi:hypothetical protein